MVMTIIATLIIAVSAMVYNQHQMKLFQFNPKYRPVIVTALGGEGTTIFGFELIGNGEDKTTQLEDYITAIKYQDGDEVIDNLISDLEEDLGYNIATALAITAGGYALATFTSCTSIPFAWFSDALLGVKSVYNVNRFYGKVSKLVDNVDPSTLNKAKSKRKQSRKKDEDISEKTRLLKQSAIYTSTLVGPKEEIEIRTMQGLGKKSKFYSTKKIRTKRSNLWKYTDRNLVRMRKGNAPYADINMLNDVLVSFGLSLDGLDGEDLDEAARITLHHNNNIPVWTKNGTMVELPWIIHSSFSKILHRKGAKKGSKEKKAHKTWAPRYWKTVAYNYDISHGTR